MASVIIRQATPADVQEAGRICFEAFYKINADHNFPPDILAVEQAIGFMGMLFSHPGFYCVVAEQDGRVVGSNCLDERAPIFGIGPITIDPEAQDRGTGRALMQAVLDRTRERNAPGVRLVQAAFHSRSMSLYAKLGFDVREPLVVLDGPKVEARFEGYSVRVGTAEDIEACHRVCRQVHGVDRGGELDDAAQQGLLRVVEHGGRVTGYTTSLGFFGHSVGETNREIQALIGAAEAFDHPGILVPSRNAELFRWCLQNGLRVVEPMTLMTIGLYSEPAGGYLPSILY